MNINGGVNGSKVKGDLDDRGIGLIKEGYQMELSDSTWVNLLSRKPTECEEAVVIVLGKLSKSLRIKKDDWRNHFSDFGGIDFRQGEEIEIVPAADGGPRADIPDWVRERLEDKSGDVVCITHRAGKYYLKKLELAEKPTDVPACIVVDKFSGDHVQRTYWNHTEFDEINHEAIDRLLGSMSRLRHNPIAPFKHMDGRLGLLGRREFLGGFTKADESIVSDYKKEICQDQQEDGSWDQSAAQTAFKLIRLLEVGATMKEEPVEKAAIWLLNAREPLGFPGLFMVSEKTADSFNAWKEKQEPGSRKRGSRSSSAGQRRIFMENQDVYGVSNSYCEVKLTWTTGIALEALLRCGLHEEKRVIKAINTLLAMSGGGGWCGCGYFVANIYHEENTNSVDFNSLSIRTRGRSLGSFGIEQRDILGLVCNHRNKGLSLGDGETLVARIGNEGDGDCAMSIYRALAFHPDYHGSKLETIAAIGYSHRQGWLGDWTGNYASFFFSLLARMRCPLSAYLVLRTIPRLVNQQRPDGLWKEQAELQRESKNPVLIPKKEESTFMILSALKAHGFLYTLMPA